MFSGVGMNSGKSPINLQKRVVLKQFLKMGFAPPPKNITKKKEEEQLLHPPRGSFGFGGYCKLNTPSENLSILNRNFKTEASIIEKNRKNGKANPCEMRRRNRVRGVKALALLYN